MRSFLGAEGHPDPPGDDAGVNLYSSKTTDLTQWHYEGRMVRPVRTAENGLDLER